MKHDEKIDAALDAVLNAAGSTLRHYTQSTKDDMRGAMRKIMRDAYIDGSNACHNAMRGNYDALVTENRMLKSMCQAAAAEIEQHWESHCDEDGYGPANLMARLTGEIPPDLYPGYGANRRGW